MAHEQYISQTVKDFIAAGDVYLSYPTRCDCGASVRLVGNMDTRGAWHCPICGNARPYVFWKVNHTPKQQVEDLSVLILALAPDACEVCGEGVSTVCRCERKRRAEEAERPAKIFPDSMKDKFSNQH